METLSNIIGVIDMDGFCVQRKFYCKELGIANINDIYAKSYHFDTGLKCWDLSKQDWRACSYVTRYVHHLPFTTSKPISEIPLRHLENIVVNFYNENRKSQCSTLRFKGGQWERELLTRLQLPHINLETLGCPKASALFDSLGWLESCGKHLPCTESYKHCPKVEVESYVMWIQNNVKTLI